MDGLVVQDTEKGGRLHRDIAYEILLWEGQGRIPILRGPRHMPGAGPPPPPPLPTSYISLLLLPSYLFPHLPFFIFFFLFAPPRPSFFLIPQ